MNALDAATAPLRSTLEVAGNKVTVLTGGDGAPVVYLHGVCDIHANFDGTHWTTFLARLTERFSVFAPALPGYNGSTDATVLDDIEDYVWHLSDLLDVLNLGPVDVVAHSLGGWFAAELALRHPAKVRRLVLVAPLGLHVAGETVPSFFGAVAPRGVGGFGEGRRLLFAQSGDDTALAALPDDMTEQQQLLWFGGLAGAARLGWKAPHFQSSKLTERLARIGVPTLVVRGEQDQLVTHGAGQAWADGMKDASLTQVPDAGHCLPLEWPGLANAVEEFLTRAHGT